MRRTATRQTVKATRHISLVASLVLGFFLMPSVKSSGVFVNRPSSVHCIDIECVCRLQRPTTTQNAEIDTVPPSILTELECTALTANYQLNQTMNEQLLFNINRISFRESDRSSIITFLSSINKFLGPRVEDIRSLSVKDSVLGNELLDGLILQYPLLQDLELRNCSIVSISESSELGSLINHITLNSQLIIDLSMNPFDCSDDLKWLIDLVSRTRSNSSNVSFKSISETKCASPPSALDMSFRQRSSVLSTSTCSVCDCFLHELRTMAVNCSNRDLSSLPHELPVDTRLVWAENNSIRSLALPADALSSHWYSVSFLYLTHNVIDSLMGLDGSKLVKNIVSLQLANNRLKSATPYILDHFIKLDAITLGGNPFECDCTTVKFQNWLQKRFRQVKDLERIRCAAESARDVANLAIIRLSKAQLCPHPSPPFQYLDLVNGLLAVSIVCVLCKLGYDWWWQRRTGKLPQFFRLNIH